MALSDKVKTLFSFYSDTVKPILAEYPVVGALAKDGLTTSEGALATALVALMGKEAVKDAPNPWVLGAEALGLIGIGVYALARSHFKGAAMAAQVEQEANARPDPILGLTGGKN
jgi:hypothetical protein